MSRTRRWRRYPLIGRDEVIDAQKETDATGELTADRLAWSCPSRAPKEDPSLHQADAPRP
jgi:hypothetical protein